MGRRTSAALLSLGLLALGAAGPAADLLSREFVFKPGVKLEMGVASDDGLLVDAVLFDPPAEQGIVPFRRSDVYAVEVAVKNTADEPRRVGVALALFDGEGRLVGVASGGSRLVGVKPGKLKVYRMSFAHVNGHVGDAASFHLSVETRP